MFGIDVFQDDLDKILFPTFEEALGILDLAIRREETLKEFGLENTTTNGSRIRFVRQYLILLMAKVLDEKLKGGQIFHPRLISNLIESNFLKETVFVSTNYDILIDNALESNYHDIEVDYGVEFANLHRQLLKEGTPSSVKLYKIHGSLNWLYCPTCNSLTLTRFVKGVVGLTREISKPACQRCNSVVAPIIVPPTFYKELSNVYLSTIWNKAEQALREVQHIVFCGYSFPDADMHLKYLMKRIQTNRKGKFRVSVVNNHRDKKESDSKQEIERFKRFLGKRVNYTELSFEQFCAEPLSLLATQGGQVAGRRI